MWSYSWINARQCRSIPTQVGKSSGCTGQAAFDSGHPHAGGEITVIVLNVPAPVGPSPRRWGNQKLPHYIRNRCRAIPTQVGKSADLGCVLGGSPGHPHAGGEIAHSRSWRMMVFGPSPRRWGNLGVKNL